MKRLMLAALSAALFFFSTSFAYAQGLTPKVQMCVNASIAVEGIGKALNKSQITEAQNIVANAALPGAQTQKIKGLIALWSTQDPKSFTPPYIQQLSQQYYSECVSR